MKGGEFNPHTLDGFFGSEINVRPWGKQYLDSWAFGAASLEMKSNRVSLSLPRFCLKLDFSHQNSTCQNFRVITESKFRKRWPANTIPGPGAAVTVDPF
jgi:hypothetical protein